MIVSDVFFHDVVAQDPAADPGSYRQILVSVKGTSTSAWLSLPDGAAPRSQVLKQAEGVPPVWGNVPPRNSNFTGRVELLEQLGNRLAPGGAAGVRSAALHGMGGVGKTQLAVEYIYRRLHDYDIVWWVQATQPAQIRAGLTELAQKLSLPEGSEATTAVPAVHEALSRGDPHRRWLLVFDSAESPDVVLPFLPTEGSGAVLITSRNPIWSGNVRPLEVPVLTRRESVELLHRLGLEVGDDEGRHLAETLGDLPLAIEQAAAWGTETGMPVREYLRLFHQKVAEILERSPSGNDEVSVAAAWNVSFDELRDRNPTAYQLLEVRAFFAPEPISRSLFTDVRDVSISGELDGALRDSLQLGAAIRDINRYGLAKVDYRSGTLLLHPLVQVVLRNRMTTQRQVEMRHGAHLLLAKYDPHDPISSKYQDVLPHVIALELIECTDPGVRQLVINVIQFLYISGDHEEAARLATNAVENWSDRLGETDPHVLEVASYLGLYLWVLGRYLEAARINERTFELRRKVSGENSEQTIKAQLRVAVDLRTSGDFAAARELNEQIHQKVMRLFGNDHRITLQAAEDLAVSLRLCGSYERALELDEDNHLRLSQVFGDDGVNILNTTIGMALDRRELGEYRRARTELENVAERTTRVLGDDKAATMRTLTYLSVARRRDGDYSSALELSGRALELYRRRYSDDHPSALDCALAHSIDLRYTGDLPEAHALGERVLAQYRAKLGEQHPSSLAAAVNLAVTLRLRDKAAVARQLNEQSLKQLAAALSLDHPYAIVCAIDLASDLAVLGDTVAASVLGSTTLRLADSVLGPDHPTTLAVSLNHSFDLRALGRTSESEALYVEALIQYRRVLGAAHPATKGAVAEVRADCDIDPLPL
ncbi:MAG TPA: NB-ARC domain-containing protein [Micromonosporaceae bacterium]|nr:NB-ARC domain-containing protein [Micromonosporaceae bacterium]